MTLSDTIDFLAKNVQAGIVIDFDRPPQEDIKCGAQVVEMENLGTQPLRLQFWRWFSFSKGGMDSFHVAAGTWKTQLPQLSYPSWGDDPIWISFQMGWKNQLVDIFLGAQGDLGGKSRSRS